MRIETGMSLTANGTGFSMAPVHKMTDLFYNLRNLRVSSDNSTKWPSLSVEDRFYSADSVFLFTNVLTFWLFLVASSYFLSRKSVNTVGSYRERHAERVSSSDSTVSNASIKNDATAASDPLSSSGCSLKISHSNCYTELCIDAYYEISVLDKACYMNSLLSLEDDGCEWLSDLMPCGSSSGEPSTPLSCKYDAYYEISDFEQGSFFHSLLSLDDEDSEWLSDSKSFGRSSEEPSTPLSYKFDVASEISDFEQGSYFRSLLSLDDEDSEWLSDSKSFGRSSDEPSTPLGYNSDSLYSISDFDKASYLHSLLSLEDEDAEWLSDSKSFGCLSDNPSTPLSYKSKISHLDKAGFLHSLPSLEDDDSEWLSDSKPRACSSENLSTPLSCRSDDFSEISDLDKASYMHSLLNLEGEESKWLSDSMSFECSSENPSTPLSYEFDAVSDISDSDKECHLNSLLILEDENSDRLSDYKSYCGCSSENSTPLSSKCDSYYNVSDLDKASYLDSLLILEDEDSEWLSDSTSWDITVPSSVSTGIFLPAVNFGNSEDSISVENLLETAGVDADEPLFWPLEGKLAWNSEEPWSSFCTSPRRRLALNSTATTSKIKECNKQKGNEAPCRVNCETSRLSMWPKSSTKIVPLECEEFESAKDFLLVGKEYFALGEELPIETFVGLKEFDGHEGFDSEFNDAFMLGV